MASSSRTTCQDQFSTVAASQLLPDTAPAWFADRAFRRALLESAVAAHAAQKILVGSPSEEIQRICPGGDRVLGAGAVLRLGGSYRGGYSESDINYAYRQLSRVLHPDKNQNKPEALKAFKRLSDAADELRDSLTEARAVLGVLSAATGSEPPTAEMLDRPHIAVFAEANRVLAAVLAASGEGDVAVAKERLAAAWRSSSVFGSRKQSELLSQWYEKPDLLEYFAGACMRTAYDTSPKCFRAQFLCMLNRAVLVENKVARSSERLSGSWSKVLALFPELQLWSYFTEQLQVRTWGSDRRCDQRALERREPESWAVSWRRAIRAVLPSSLDEGTAENAAEIRKLAISLWADVAEWAKGAGMQNVLELFIAEPAGTCSDHSGDPTGLELSAWSFVPAADLLLVVGGGLAGISAAGFFADSPQGHLCEAFTKELLQLHDSGVLDAERERLDASSQLHGHRDHAISRPGRRSRSHSRRPVGNRHRDFSRSRPSLRRSRSRSRARSGSRGRWLHDKWIGRETSRAEECKPDDQVAGQDCVDDDSVSQWSCSTCTALNHHLLRECEVCETPRTPVEQRERANEPGRTGGYSAGVVCRRQWTCAVCTFKNHPDLQECEMCQVGRGAKAYLAYLAANSRSQHGQTSSSSRNAGSGAAVAERTPADSSRRR